MLMPSIGSISGVVHLAARKPHVIAVIVVLLALTMVGVVSSRQTLTEQWTTIHQAWK
jgi:CHASE1-domain containing sensor protein